MVVYFTTPNHKTRQYFTTPNHKTVKPSKLHPWVIFGAVFAYVALWDPSVSTGEQQHCGGRRAVGSASRARGRRRRVTAPWKRKERGGTTYLVLCVGPRMPHNQKPATKTSQGCILDDFDSIGVCPIWFCGFRLQSRLPWQIQVCNVDFTLSYLLLNYSRTLFGCMQLYTHKCIFYGAM